MMSELETKREKLKEKIRNNETVTSEEIREILNLFEFEGENENESEKQKAI